MPIQVNGQLLYRIGEALKLAGISRPTYFRWVKAGKLPDTKYLDRNSRRLFTTAELEILQSLALRLIEASPATFEQRTLPFRRADSAG